MKKKKKCRMDPDSIFNRRGLKLRSGQRMVWWFSLILAGCLFLQWSVLATTSRNSQERFAKANHTGGGGTRLTALPEASGSVLYIEGGRLVCRVATPEEALAMTLRDPTRRLRFITPVEPGKQQAGLRIMLRATTQLDNFPQAKQAFIRAAQTWESFITTPITLVIDVDFGLTRFGEPFPQGVLGSTFSQELFNDSGYPDVKSALIQGASSQQETSLFQALPSGQVPTDLGATTGIFAPSSVFRALGLIAPVADPEGEMGNFGPPPSIGFNSNFNWDFNPDDGIDFDKQDFDGTAVHEIGHALGFVSTTGFRELDSTFPVAVSVWDLYRFRPGGGANFSTAQRILSSGGNQVFFAGGPELQLSTGRPDGSGGDGNQASHWKDDELTGVFIGVMDPTEGQGFRTEITQNDLAALDVMGYAIGGGQPPPDGDTVPLTSGLPVNGSIQDIGALGATQYTIDVPSGATQLEVGLSGNQDVDLFVRFGQRVEVQNGQAVADFRSESLTGNESITITPASSPPLQPGTYFIAVANFGPGAASFTVTATVSGGGPPPGGETEIAIDDGTFENTIGLISGGTIFCVNRLTPSSYPATLSQVAIYFQSGSGLQGSESLTVVAGSNDGSSNIDGTPFQSTNGAVQSLDQFNLYDVPDITIASGDFVIGFRMTQAPNVFPCSIDQNPPSQRRSYVSIDGTDFDIIDDVDASLAGNFGIRARLAQAPAEEPDIEVSPTSLEFGQVPVGQSINQTLTVRNSGNAALTVNTITSSNPQFSVLSPTGSFTIAAGSRRIVSLRFTPFSPGTQTGLLTIRSDDPDEATVEVTLRGVGTAAAAPDINVTPASLAFGSIPVGQTADQTVTVANVGNAALTVNSITANSALFSIISPTGSFTVNAGGQQMVSVRFAPTVAGTQTGRLSISSNDPDESVVVVNMTGEGTAGAGRRLSVPDSNGNPGQTVTVPVQLSDGSGISGFQFVLSFDPSVLSLPGPQAVTAGSLLPNNFSLSANTATAGQVSVLISPPIQQPLPTFNSGSGAVVNVAFQVNPAASIGSTSPLTLSGIVASDANGVAVAVSPQNGTFSVGTPRRLSIPDVQGSAGSTVAIPVNLSEGAGISALQFILGFDPAILSPAGTTPVVLGPLAPGNFSLSVNTGVAGQLSIVITPPLTSPLPSFSPGSGAVVRVTFQVAGTASGGSSSPLTLSNIVASDANSQAVSVTAQNGTFTVSSLLSGDVNEDGAVNVLDVIRLIRHITGEQLLTGNGLAAADVNSDGQVNVLDVIRLIRAITGEQPLSLTLLPADRIQPVRVRAGEIIQTPEGITVPIEVSDATNLAGVQLVIDYDPEQLRLGDDTSASLGELVPDGFELFLTETRPGRLMLLLTPPLESPLATLFGGLGTLLNLHFVPQNEADAASLRIVRAVLSDSRGRPLPVGLEPRE